MTSELEIIANERTSVNAVGVDRSLDVDIHHTSRVMPLGRLDATIDAYEVYRNEVAQCDKYRIITNISPFCSNILFNACTEVNINEGGDTSGDNMADSVVGSNTWTPSRGTSEIKGKTSNLDRPYMVRNTEYSKFSNVEYHPGMDIFSNHLLRSLTFKKVNDWKNGYTPSITEQDKFNTMRDQLRSFYGDPVLTFNRTHIITPSNPIRLTPESMYNDTEILPFGLIDGQSLAINENLRERNGWLGFYNNTTPRPKLSDETKAEHVINNKNNCEFIEMYPDSTLYSFMPKYNEYKKRQEHNWSIFLTYPYESFYGHPIVSNVAIKSPDGKGDTTNCDGKTNALYVFDTQKVKAGNGSDVVMFRTLTRHGLNPHDYIYVYYSHDKGVTYTRTEKAYMVSNTGDMSVRRQDNYFYISDNTLLNELFNGHILDYFYREVFTTSYAYEEMTEDSSLTYNEVPANYIYGNVTSTSYDYVKIRVQGATTMICNYGYYERQYTYNQYMRTGVYSYAPITEADIHTQVNWNATNSFPVGQMPTNVNAGSPRYVRVLRSQTAVPFYTFYKKITDCTEYDSIPTDIPQSLENAEHNGHISVTYYVETTTPPMTTWPAGTTLDNLPEHANGYPQCVRVRQDSFLYYIYDAGMGIYRNIDGTTIPQDYEWTADNTFDDIPANIRLPYIRVYRFKFYTIQTRYYDVITTFTGSEVSYVENAVDKEVAYRLNNDMSIRFRRYKSGYESSYYVRKLKKIPNWRYRRDELTDEIGGNNVLLTDFINANAVDSDGRMYDFDRELYHTAFSRTLFGDRVSQAVFTESVDIAHLADNLGRPLTNIYTTIIRNNTGYKEWYAASSPHYADYEAMGEYHRIEFSHCFGRLAYGFDYTVYEDDKDRMRERGWLSDVHVLAYPQEAPYGHECRSIEQWDHLNDQGYEPTIYDEVFYCDVVEFIPAECREVVLQEAQIRFNTAQREIANPISYVFDFDDFDSDGNVHEYNDNQDSPHYSEDVGTDVVRRLEGYFYKPNYAMPVREFGDVVHQSSHTTVSLRSAEPIQMDGIFIKVRSRRSDIARLGQRAYICDVANNRWYPTSVSHIIDNRTFAINIIPRDSMLVYGIPYVDWITICEKLNSGEFSLRLHNMEIPLYASQISQNTFLWRDIIHTGDILAKSIADYPFANGHLYIHQGIRFFLRRQDPFGWCGIQNKGYNIDLKFQDRAGKPILGTDDDYITEQEITC